MFETFQLSRWHGRPVTLYRFDRQHLSWLYAAADRPIEISGDTYQMAPGMRRGGITSGGNDKQSELKIHVPYLLDPAADSYPPTQSLGDNWRPFTPGDEVLVTVMEAHPADPDAEIQVIWTGHVMQPVFTDTEMTLTCAPGRMGARKSGMIPRFTRNCWVPWGSQGRGMCNVNRETFAADAELTAVSGLDLTAAAFGEFPSGRLWGGFIRWERPDGLVERRDIQAHSDSTITINSAGPGVAPGLQVRVYPGCKHNEQDCRDYFDNQENYPGVKTIPIRALFDGNRRVR